MNNKISFILAILFSVFLFASCEDTKEKEKTEFTDSELGFIDADLMQEEGLLGEKPEFVGGTPGSGDAKIDRAFENAPPMIPHTVEGFFPITIDNNVCTSCHLPEVADAVNATPIAASHFQNWRPEVIEKDGLYEVKDNEKAHTEDLGRLNNAYYNCSQCHVPLTNVKVNIENLFTPEFREELGKNSSNLNKNYQEGL